MMRFNNSFYVNQELINEFYLTQKNWKDKIIKRNKELYLKKEEEKVKEENKIKNYKIKINEKSKRIVENKLKKYYTINNTNNLYSKKNNKEVKKTNKSYEAYELLYKDALIHEEKINNLKKSYYNTLFKPSINHSFVNNRQLTKKNKKKIYSRNDKKKINNIATKKIKNKTFSVTFEDISMPITYDKKISRNSRINNLNNIGSTKSTVASNNIKNMNNLGVDSVSNKLFSTTQIKEMNPLPKKLGEIKEMDSAYYESSARNKNVNENKDNKLNNSQGNNFINKESKLNI